MKTAALLLLFFGSIIWTCTKSGKSRQQSTPVIYEPDPLEKMEPDPFRRQLKRFGYDVTTGTYTDYPAYKGNGC